MDKRKKLVDVIKESLMKHIGKSCNLAENIADDILEEGSFYFPEMFNNDRRKRMVELLNSLYNESTTGHVMFFTDEESEELADYILADGWIRPPCKIGDVVYDKEGNSYMVKSIELCSKNVMHLHCNGRTFSVGKRSIGKTVFLSANKIKPFKGAEDDGNL